HPCNRDRLVSLTGNDDGQRLPLGSYNGVLPKRPTMAQALPRLTSNCSSCRNCMPYRYSSGNSSRSSCMRAGPLQTQSRKSQPRESRREFWHSFSYKLKSSAAAKVARGKRCGAIFLSGCMGQSFFDLVDQLGNIDGLGHRSMPVDAETSLCLRFSD